MERRAPYNHGSTTTFPHGHPPGRHAHREVIRGGENRLARRSALQFGKQLRGLVRGQFAHGVAVERGALRESVGENVQSTLHSYCSSAAAAARASGTTS